MQLINIFGGPGVGKSAIASEVFSRYKQNNFNIEFLLNRFNSDRLFTLADQNRKLRDLINSKEYVITNSPLLLNIIYNQDIDPNYFNPLVLNLHSQYENINVFLERNPQNTYLTYKQFTYTEENARQIDQKILDMFEEYHIKYKSFIVNHRTSEKIIELVYARNDPRYKN